MVSRSVENISRLVSDYPYEFRRKHELRERAIKVSREVIRTSANALQASPPVC